MALLLLPSDVFFSRARIPRIPSSYLPFQCCTRLPHSQPPLTPCCSGAASISHQMSESTHHFQTHHILISVLPDTRAVVSAMSLRIHQFSKTEAWSPRAANCGFASAHSDRRDFFEALQDCTARHSGNVFPREQSLETFSLLFWASP